MPTKTFSASGTVNMGIEAKSDAGYRVLSYSGFLGGGTLRVLTQCADGADQVPVPDAKLSAANVDGNGDAIQQLVFVSAGNVYVSLTNATAPTCKVSVQ